MSETEPKNQPQPQPQSAGTEEPKTARDIEIEKLNARLDALETKYNEEKTQWQKANKELFSMLHSQPAPAPAGTVTTGPNVPTEPTAEGFVKQFARKKE